MYPTQETGTSHARVVAEWLRTLETSVHCLYHFDQTTDMSTRSFTLLISSQHRLLAYEDGLRKENGGLPPFFKTASLMGSINKPTTPLCCVSQQQQDQESFSVLSLEHLSVTLSRIGLGLRPYLIPASRVVAIPPRLPGARTALLTTVYNTAAFQMETSIFFSESRITIYGLFGFRSVMYTKGQLGSRCQK